MEAAISGLSAEQRMKLMAALAPVQSSSIEKGEGTRARGRDGLAANMEHGHRHGHTHAQTHAHTHAQTHAHSRARQKNKMHTGASLAELGLAERHRHGTLHEEQKGGAAAPWRSRMQHGRKVCIMGISDEVDGTKCILKGAGKLEKHTPAGIKALREMQHANCEVNIVLTHAWTGVDLIFWRDAVVKENLRIDVMMGGHDHIMVAMKLQYKGKMTQYFKSASDAKYIGKIAISLDSSPPPTTTNNLPWGTSDTRKISFSLIPVVKGDRCVQPSDTSGQSGAWELWSEHLEKTFNGPVYKAMEEELPIAFSGIYDTSNVRRHETRAANLWADLQRQATNADAVLMMGGSLRGDKFLNYGAMTQLTYLDLLEEQPLPGELYTCNFMMQDLLGFIGKIGAKAHCDANKSMSLPSLLHASGFEVHYKQEPCKLWKVIFWGKAHVNGAMDLREAQKDNCTVQHTEQSHHRPGCGEALYQMNEWGMPKTSTKMVRVSGLFFHYCKWSGRGEAYIKKHGLEGLIHYLGAASPHYREKCPGFKKKFAKQFPSKYTDAERSAIEKKANCVLSDQRDIVKEFLDNKSFDTRVDVKAEQVDLFWYLRGVQFDRQLIPSRFTNLPTRRWWPEHLWEKLEESKENRMEVDQGLAGSPAVRQIGGELTSAKDEGELAKKAVATAGQWKRARSAR
jgi:hypothetical protein